MLRFGSGPKGPDMTAPVIIILGTIAFFLFRQASIKASREITMRDFIENYLKKGLVSIKQRANDFLCPKL